MFIIFSLTDFQIRRLESLVTQNFEKPKQSYKFSRQVNVLLLLLFYLTISSEFSNHFFCYQNNDPRKEFVLKCLFLVQNVIFNFNFTFHIFNPKRRQLGRIISRTTSEIWFVVFVATLELEMSVSEVEYFLDWSPDTSDLRLEDWPALSRTSPSRSPSATADNCWVE